MGIVEFYTHLVTIFGLEACYRRAADVPRAQRSHPGHEHKRPYPSGAALDEAHLLNNDILAEIRLLTNYQIDSLNALTVVLCGAETLSCKFGLSMLEALANSITITISMDSLPKEESFTYIESRLAACGQKSPLFTKNAMELVHQAAGGILRTIGTIANAALLKDYSGQEPSDRSRACPGRHPTLNTASSGRHACSRFRVFASECGTSRPLLVLREYPTLSAREFRA